jgi:adenosylmethionine-8-amino-7-oxononanoate aminotransferase
MSVAGPSLFNKPFADLFFEVLTIPYPEKGKKTNAAKITKKLLEAHPDCALLVYEPMVQGSAGMRMADPKELSLILKSVRTSSALLIADEVMTGFGRTGTLFASEQLSVKPDLVCMSKGITGGFLPMGATAVNTKVFEAFASSDSGKTFYHGHSYTASPLACAAANASLKLLLTKSCEKDRLRINRSHIDFSQKLKTHPLVENVRTCGTIFAFEVRQIKNDYLSRIRDPLYLSFIKKGVLLRPLGNTVYILTPYTISDKEIKTVYQAIEKTLDEMLEANR